MKTIFKRMFVLSAFFAVIILLIIYFTSTANTIYKLVYFSGDAALKSWISSDSEVVFEYRTDDFVLLYDNDSLNSAKKEGLLWVKDNRDGYNEETYVISTAMKETAYVYGNVYIEGIEQVILNDPCGTIEYKTDSRKIDDGNLLFCMEIPIKELHLSTLISFVDKTGNVVSNIPVEQESEERQLVNSIVDNIEHTKYSLYTDLDINSTYMMTLKKKYYINSNGEIELMRDGVIFHFCDQNVIVDKDISINMLRKDGLKHYSETYVLPYTEELLKLKTLSS